MKESEVKHLTQAELSVEKAEQAMKWEIIAKLYEALSQGKTLAEAIEIVKQV